MDELELLKVLLQEDKYPYFNDATLESFLELYEGDCYLVASKLAIMKADGDKKIKVGPIEIEGPGAEYWITLSKEYANNTSSNKSNTNSGYKTSMKRADRQ